MAGPVATLLAVVLAGSNVAAGAIDLTLDPLDDVVEVGDEIAVRLIASPDDDMLAFVAALDAVLAWDPGPLVLVGTSQAGAVPLLFAGFPGSSPLNESNPPADGDALFTALAPLGDPIDVLPGGVLVTTFLFEAVAETPATTIDLLPNLDGQATTVFDGTIPNLDVTGSLEGATITVVPGPGAIAVLLAAFLPGAACGSSRRRRRNRPTPRA